MEIRTIRKLNPDTPYLLHLEHHFGGQDLRAIDTLARLCEDEANEFSRAEGRVFAAERHNTDADRFDTTVLRVEFWVEWPDGDEMRCARATMRIRKPTPPET